MKNNKILSAENLEEITPIEELIGKFTSFKKYHNTQIKHLNNQMKSLNDTMERVEQLLNILTKQQMNNKIFIETNKKEEPFLKEAITLDEHEKRIFMKDDYENNPYNDSLYEDTDKNFLDEEDLTAEQIRSILNLENEDNGSLENFDNFNDNEEINDPDDFEEDNEKSDTTSFPSYQEIRRLEKERQLEERKNIERQTSYDDIMNEEKTKEEQEENEKTETYDLASFLEQNIILEEKNEPEEPVKKKKRFFK